MYLSRFVRLIRHLIYASILIFLWEQLITQAFIRLLRVRNLSPYLDFFQWPYDFIFPLLLQVSYVVIYLIYSSRINGEFLLLCVKFFFYFLPTKVEKLCDIFRFSLTISSQRLSLFCSRDKGSAWVHSNRKTACALLSQTVIDFYRKIAYQRSRRLFVGNQFDEEEQYQRKRRMDGNWRDGFNDFRYIFSHYRNFTKDLLKCQALKSKV